MTDEVQQNGTKNGDVPEIELIIKVCVWPGLLFIYSTSPSTNTFYFPSSVSSKTGGTILERRN